MKSIIKKIFFVTIITASTLVKAEPIIIPTEHSTVLLSEPAKRIVVLEPHLLNDLLQLGLKPIGYTQNRANNSFVFSKLNNNIANVGTDQQPDFDKIISLHPDLIIADATTQHSMYPFLKQIAPTLMLNGSLTSASTHVENLKLLSKATATENKAQLLISELNTKHTSGEKIRV